MQVGAACDSGLPNGQCQVAKQAVLASETCRFAMRNGTCLQRVECQRVARRSADGAEGRPNGMGQGRDRLACLCVGHGCNMCCIRNNIRFGMKIKCVPKPCFRNKMTTFAPQKTSANKIMDDYHAENFNL